MQSIPQEQEELIVSSSYYFLSLYPYKYYNTKGGYMPPFEIFANTIRHSLHFESEVKQQKQLLHPDT